MQMQVTGTVDGTYNNSRGVTTCAAAHHQWATVFQRQDRILTDYQRLLNDRLCAVNHVRQCFFILALCAMADGWHSGESLSSLCLPAAGRSSPTQTHDR